QGIAQALQLLLLAAPRRESLQLLDLTAELDQGLFKGGIGDRHAARHGNKRGGRGQRAMPDLCPESNTTSYEVGTLVRGPKTSRPDHDPPPQATGTAERLLRKGRQGRQGQQGREK